jgi:transposase-like protein
MFRCPHCGNVLHVRDTTTMSDAAVYLHVSCGCGFKVEGYGTTDLEALRSIGRAIKSTAQCTSLQAAGN